MDLDLRPFPDLPTSLATLLVWAVGLVLLTATLAVRRHEPFFEAADRCKIPLMMLCLVGAFHAMAGWRAAQLIAAGEAVVVVLLWLLALTLPLQPRDDEQEPVAERHR
jgi:hypothetical protein